MLFSFFDFVLVFGVASYHSFLDEEHFCTSFLSSRRGISKDIEGCFETISMHQIYENAVWAGSQEVFMSIHRQASTKKTHHWRSKSQYFRKRKKIALKRLDCPFNKTCLVRVSYMREEWHSHTRVFDKTDLRLRSKRKHLENPVGVNGTTHHYHMTINGPARGSLFMKYIFWGIQRKRDLGFSLVNWLFPSIGTESLEVIHKLPSGIPDGILIFD